MRFVPGQRIKKVRGKLAVGLEATFSHYHPATSLEGWDMVVLPLASVEFPIVMLTMIGLVEAIGSVYAGNPTEALSDQWEPAIPPDMESIEEASDLLQTDEVIA